MKSSKKFYSLLNECIEDTLNISNDEKSLFEILSFYFDQFFSSYRVFLAREYNYLFSVYLSENRDNEVSRRIRIPSSEMVFELDFSFVYENMKYKIGSNSRDFYISTVLFKKLVSGAYFKFSSAKDTGCPLCYRYLMSIKSKKTLLGMVNFSFLQPVFSPSQAMEQLLLLQKSLSNIFETYHLYKDFDIKINEFMKLKDSTEMIIESIDLGIIVMEYHNKLRAINRRALEMLGIERGIPDFDLNNIIKERFNENILDIIKHNLKTSESSIKLFDKEYRSHDSIKRIDLVICPYKDISNRVTGFIIIIDDITERKKYEEKLLRQEKLASLGQVIAGVAHEINTPLAGIRSYSQLLKDSLSNRELLESSKYTDKIIQQVDRCSNIIDELLSFARKKKANKTYFNLNDLLKETVSMTETLIKGKEIDINILANDRNAMIFGDRVKIEQVMLNLILNAKDAIEKKGSIDIIINEKENSLELIIRDNGKGIPDEDLFRIFDPFFTTKKKAGTGLGLSLSYGVIKDHNGDIKVKSEYGKGTEFIITLPKS